MEFKEFGYETTTNELDKNLIDKNVMDMLLVSITHNMTKMPLAYPMFLKRKRCGKIKARGCTDGRSQREYITKLQSSSPCVKTHALFLSCLVDSFERRKSVYCIHPRSVPISCLAS